MTGLRRSQADAAVRLIGGVAAEYQRAHGIGPGSHLGRYVVIDALGEGGLSQVFRAFDPELDRSVAVKVLKSRVWGGIDEAWEERLVREAKALAALDDPHVVKVFDVGRHEGRVFVAMELVRGWTLREWATRSKPGWRAARAKIVDAARGVVAAHEAGVIHRDFKPENVLVDTKGRVRVVDFGLAQRVRLEAAAGDDGTESDGLVGTLAYMAPEQLQGEAADARSDQFAVCCTLAELLFGEHPFFGEDARTRLASIAAGPQTLAGSRGVPGWLRSVVFRGLSVEPCERFGSMAELVTELQADQRRRRRRALGVAGALVLAAGLGAGVATVVQPEPQVDEARIEALVAEALAAADRRAYLLPREGDAPNATAYQAILALEQLDGDNADMGRARAADLRRQLSERLAATGDDLQRSPEHATFAADLYAAAVVFDPSNATARRATTLTGGEIADLRRRATELDHTPAERVAAMTVAAAAEPDPEQRRRRLEALRQRLAPSTRTRLQADDELRVDADSPDRTPRRNIPVVAAAAEAAPEASAASEDAPARGGGSDAERAAAETKAARNARAKGRLRDAEQHYTRALVADRSHGPALAGLAQLHFDEGRTHRALDFAKRAVAASPRRGAYAMLLGDLYFKVLRFDDARQAYRRAREHGRRSEADAALARLDARLGR